MDDEDLEWGMSPPIDRVDTILDVAGSVLADYGGRPGSTRVERLARWVIANLDACPTVVQAGGIARFHCARTRHPDHPVEAVEVTRIGSIIAIRGDTQRALTSEDAREIATGLLRAVELAEAA